MNSKSDHNSTRRIRLALSGLPVRRRWQVGIAGILLALTLALLWLMPTPARADDPISLNHLTAWLSGDYNATYSVIWGNEENTWLVSNEMVADQSGIYGTVTYNGATVADIELWLRFYNGSSWSTAATTYTEADGSYSFTGVPSLSAGQSYYVRFPNVDSLNSYLSVWYCNSITSYTAGDNVPGGDFDIANVPLVAPAPNITEELPVTFSWVARGIVSDTYQLRLFDPTDSDPNWYSEDVGYAGSHTLNSLPSGFSNWVQYGWSVRVNNIDGWGASYYYRAITFPVFMSVIYVDTSASGVNDGTSWGDAYTDLQSALTTAMSGTQIYVAAGVYTPTANSTDRTATFQLVDGVAVYGGFPAGGGIFDDRDPGANPTILSGDIDDNDLAVPATDASQIVGNNSYHVVTGYGVGLTTVLDGFTISGGQANGTGNDDDGGGMYNNSSSPTLTDVIFSGNSADEGGGMHNYSNSNPTLTNVTFNGNSADEGGGMYNGSSSPTLTDVTFSDNSASGGMYNNGGGMSNFNSNPTLANVTFNGNSADDGGGMVNLISNPTLANVTFSGNSANRGGGMYDGGSSSTLANVIFSGNLANYGGGVYNDKNSSPTLANVTFSGNSATEVGGGMGNDGGSPTLMNVIFSSNSANNYGGGMYNRDNSSPTLTNVTFTGNSATSGGGMYNKESSLPQINNGILWGNVAGTGTVANQQIYNDETSVPFIHYTLVQGSGGSGVGWDTSLGTDGDGNVGANPAFLRAPSPGPDTVWGTADDVYGDLHLQTTSPAIDAGDNSALPADSQDLDDDGNTSESIPFDPGGNPRQVDIVTTPDSGVGAPPIVDIGAYETQPFLSLVKSVTPQRAGLGQQVAYHLTFHNVGPGTATGVVVSDVMPISITVSGVSSSLPITEVSAGPSYAWQVADLPMGASGVITLTGVVSTALDGGETLWNTATITATEADPNPDDNQVSVPLYVTEIIYVDASSSGADDGTSWADAYTDMQPALSRAYAGYQIWVAAGVYKPTTASTDRSAAFQLVDGVEVYGGFPPGGSIFALRDPSANLTVLSGDIDDNDLSVPADNAAQIVGNNSYHVVSSNGVRSITVLDGFTVSGGQANGGGYSNGGGLYNINGSDLRLKHVVFSGNYATNGGGMYNNGSQPTLVDVAFGGNTAASSGGGLYTDGSDPMLTNVAFHGNTASSGGGIYNSGSSSTWNNILFAGNAASGNGGGTYNSGGSPLLTNATFASNDAGNLGGGMYNGGGSTPQIDNSIWWGNTSASAIVSQKQIANVSAAPVLRYCLVQGALESGVWDTSLGIDGGGNTDADPAFVRDPDPGADATWGSGDDDYGDLRLQAQSAAIDAGDNNAVPPDSQDLDGDDETSEPTPLDLGGEPRFTDVTTTDDTGVGPPPIVDMGAYEAQLRLQVRVTQEDGAPAARARVYYLPVGETSGAEPLGGAGSPLLTNGQGVLQAPGGFHVGGGLLAAWPLTATESYILYYTSAAPTLTGVDWQIITDTEIVQHLVVSPDHPLTRFDLDVSLEWDAHNDPSYPQQLEFDLQKASQYLYDFTNGQVALGQVTVHQNADYWIPSHVVVQATNRLRPLATQGGIVVTTTVDPHHEDIVYDIGQVRMGATWNRYGDPGQTSGGDWPLALAHELSHYFLFLDDVYLGLDEDGLLIPVDTCTGSAMGDMYDPDNTEFIYDPGHWQANCADTLANRTLGRTEWETIHLWYPWLITPTVINSGPSLMPFDFTEIHILDPITPTDALADPTFYLDYEGGVVGSSEARAFLLRNEYENKEGYDYVIDLGSPLGGQNRLLARGAQPGDRLCVFDQAHRQYGCEVIETGDERLDMEQDENWRPFIRLTPVTSRTLTVQVDAQPETLTLRARLYPEYGFGGKVITLTYAGGIYSGTFQLPYPAMVGHVQVWVDKEATETDPRRETIVAYTMGGNPGGDRDAWPALRGSWPALRGSWPALRGSWPASRGAWAPLVSPDGQMIFFTENPALFSVGELHTIQNMAALPPLPEGKVAVGQGYNLIASPNVTRPLTGSISFQYLTIDALVEGADEEELTIHFWEGDGWRVLETVRSPYYNLASALSQGGGVYALLAGVTTPRVEAVNPSAATNEVTTTLVISGGYFLPPVEVALVGHMTRYTLPLQSVSPISITAVVTRGLPACEYQVVVVNRNQPGGPAVSPTPGTFALYDPAPSGACFYDFFESGAGKWELGGEWSIVTLSDSEQAMTDSPEGNYDSAIPPAITHTTYITSQAFSLDDCTRPVLTFRHDYAIAKGETHRDIGRVEISTDDGATWTELANYSGGGIFGVQTLRTPDTKSLEWTDAHWKDVMIDLSAYTGAVRLRFGLEVDRHASDKGWVIDDVIVQGMVQPRPLIFLPLILREE